jgi:hypothetical protein
MNEGTYNLQGNTSFEAGTVMNDLVVRVLSNHFVAIGKYVILGGVDSLP